MEQNSYHAKEYAARIVQAGLRGDPFEKPDEQSSDVYFSVLSILYDLVQRGGPDAFRKAWEMLKVTQPDIAELEHWWPKFINANQLSGLRPPRYLTTRYPVYEKAFNVLVGPSGAGKSQFALLMAAIIAKMNSVVYIAGEGLNGFAARWQCLKKYYSMSTENLTFYTEPLQLRDRIELAEFMDGVQQYHPVLIIVDTLARSAVGLEENSAKEMGELIGSVDTLRRELDCAVLIVHHTGVSGRIRGSTALYAAADSVISLKREDGTIVLRNDMEGGGKNKYDEPAAPMYFELKPYEVDGVKSAVLVEQDRRNTSQVEPANISPNQQAILDSLDGLENGLTPQDIVDASEVAKSSVYRNLKRLQSAGFVREDDGRYFITESGMDVL